MLLVTMLKILTWIYNCFLSPNGVIDILRPLNTVNASLLKGFIIIYSSPAACAWYTKYYVQLCFHLLFTFSLSLSPSFSHTFGGLCHSSCCIFYNTIVILNEEDNELWIVNAGVMTECFVCVWSRYRLVSYLQPLMWRALKVRSEKKNDNLIILLFWKVWLIGFLMHPEDIFRLVIRTVQLDSVILYTVKKFF